jgi:DNA-directed RNA polymerase specialized sigma subunit
MGYLDDFFRKQREARAKEVRLQAEFIKKHGKNGILRLPQKPKDRRSNKDFITHLFFLSGESQSRIARALNVSRQNVHKMVKRLQAIPAKYPTTKAILYLYYREGMTQQVTAKIMGCSQQYVSKTIVRSYFVNQFQGLNLLQLRESRANRL